MGIVNRLLLFGSTICLGAVYSSAFAEMQVGTGYAADGSVVPVFIDRAPRLKYPRKAQRLGVEGYALIGGDVKADGTQYDLRVLDAEPRSIFDKSALAFVEAMDVKPPLKDGTAVDLRDVEFKVIFKLD